MTKPKVTFRTTSLKTFLRDVLNLTYFYPADDAKTAEKAPIIYRYEPGKSKLILITGENATGKSFLRRVLASACRQNKIEAMGISMEKRAGDDGNRIANAFIWGDERDNATGCLSINAILGGIRTSSKRENKHAIIWDEPDIGLSENYAAGAGDEIARFISTAPDKLFFAAVTTHRRALLQQLLAAKPHHIRLGDNHTLEEVMNLSVTPKSLEALQEANITLFRRLHKDFGI